MDDKKTEILLWLITGLLILLFLTAIFSGLLVGAYLG